jgi:predicted secreted protein
MAIQKLRGTQLFIKIETSTPGTFAHPCLINTKRGIKFTCNSNKIVVPDCDNPDDPAWQEVLVDALAMSISGTGVLDLQGVADFSEWFMSGAGKNIQVWLGTFGYWEGSFKLTDFESSGDRNAYADCTIGIDSDGEIDAFVTA